MPILPDGNFIQEITSANPSNQIKSNQGRQTPGPLVANPKITCDRDNIANRAFLQASGSRLRVVLS